MHPLRRGVLNWIGARGCKNPLFRRFDFQVTTNSLAIHPKKGLSISRFSSGTKSLVSRPMQRTLDQFLPARAFVRRRTLGSVWLAVAIATVGFGHPVQTGTAAEPEPLGEVRLTLTKQPPPPPAERRPRVALFLIDCSSSMREGINGKTPGPGNPQRWAEVRRGLEQVLRELYAASEGIEVRIRFSIAWGKARLLRNWISPLT